MHALVLLAVLKLTLRLELGPEYDSNANRSEVVRGNINNDPPIGSALVRTTARVDFAWKRSSNLLRLRAGLGTKIFFDRAVFDEDVFVAQAGLEDHVRFSRHAELTVLGDYYDAFQNLVPTKCDDCLRRRDFRTESGGLRLTAFQGPGAVFIGAAFRGFTYKPDPYFDFTTPIGEIGASVSTQLGTDESVHELTFSTSYRIEHRTYNGLQQLRDNTPACAPTLPLADECLISGTHTRVDYFHEAGAELTYVGMLLAGIGYGIQLDTSNSFGQSLLRHVVTLRLGYRLPWHLYASAKAQLIVSNGLDHVQLDPQVSNLTFATIEDENRNAVILDLEREVKSLGLSVNARYSFFASQLGAQQTTFRRHVAYLGLTYRFSTR